MECVGALVLLGVMALYGVLAAAGQYLSLYRARRAYRESLGELRRDPHNPELRARALDRGRRYAAVTRNMRGVTPFDESALMSAIHAACAPSPGEFTDGGSPGRPFKESGRGQ